MNVFEGFWNWLCGLFGGGKKKGAKQPPANEPIRGWMATDWGQLKNPGIKDEDCKAIREKINTLFWPMDLAVIRPDGSGAGKARPHIEPARAPSKITGRGEANIKHFHKKGFRIVVTLGNEPTVRHKYSHLMAGLDYHPGLRARDLYSNERLRTEKACWTDLIQKSGKYLYGAVLYLEPSRAESIDFCKSLALHIRSLGFEGVLYSNGIGRGEWKGGPAKVRSMPSLNSLDAWMNSNADLRNCDGVKPDIDENNVQGQVGTMTRFPGPDGWMLYLHGSKGNSTGPTPFQKFVLRWIFHV